ncbi:hypothetical protein RIR_jg17131.t1 [Rhizophagus irregularis DAOM 181602=DAOM 197198]|nr:hypothetical protein RIR_jg17131.t1 [Rhizophagus irregularis DAOM 181602=DAOM 197198]
MTSNAPTGSDSKFDYILCLHALIVSALRLHLFAAIKSVPPANTFSTGMLVALLIIKINLLANVILIINNNNSYTYL